MKQVRSSRQVPPQVDRELALPRRGHDRPSGPSSDRTEQQTRHRTFRLYLDRPSDRGPDPQGLAPRIAGPRDVLPAMRAQRRAAVKLAAARVAAFLRRPDPEIRAVLFYGPDAGLVRERADAVARTVCPDLRDPFRVAELTAAALAADPARLADEAAQISLMGGSRVVRVREAGDALAPLCGRFLAECAGRRAGRRRGRRSARPLGAAPRLRRRARRRRDRLLSRQCARSRRGDPGDLRGARHRDQPRRGRFPARSSRRRPAPDPRRTRKADALCRRRRPDRVRRRARRDRRQRRAVARRRAARGGRGQRRPRSTAPWPACSRRASRRSR